MSENTEADRNKMAAFKSIEAAIVLIAKIVVEQCPGAEFFNEEARQRLNKNFATLIEVRDSFFL